MNSRKIIEGMRFELGLADRIWEIPHDQIQDATSPSYSTNEKGEIIGISLTHQNLADIPRQIGKLDKLETLRLFGNRITHLPAWLGNLEGLRRLYLGSNLIDDITPYLPFILHLEVLGLNSNPISRVPDEIHRLSKLAVLGLSKTAIQDLPDSVGLLPSLAQLYLSSCALLTVPKIVYDLKNLQVLILSNNPLRSFGDARGSLPRLEWLDISKTGIVALDEAFDRYDSLLILDARASKLARIGSSLDHCRMLRTLDVSYTCIGPSLRAAILPQTLTELSLIHCGIVGFPENILDLSSLAELRLSNNDIRVIPSEISRLAGLQILQARLAQIEQIPAQLFELPRLSSIDLRENKIRTLPKSITGYRFPVSCARKAVYDDYIGINRGVWLNRNPFESPPIEVISAGKKALRAYFESLGEASQPVNEAKVLFVGDGGAGKTSLIKCLTGYEFDPNERSTHGIQISDMELLHGGKRVSAHYWDFGGQEIMHATHQFFLSKRSAYVLVLDGRKEEKTEYWLKHIESFGGGSPILVVLNKYDENRSFEVNRRFLLQKYPSIVDFIRCSCSTGEGVDAIAKKLAETVADLESIRTAWPQSWFAVKETLGQSTNDYISLEDFVAICERHALVERPRQLALLDFLHDLGVILHFRDLPLKDTNVINPKWVTDGVYRIVNSAILADQCGTLDTTEQLPVILDSRTHPESKHSFIVELMKKFELCFQIDAHNVLLPTHLPVEQPTFLFDGEAALNLVLDYDFLPNSIIPRFIVRMHDEIDGSLRWRTGVVLSSKHIEARAWIRADTEDARIYVTATGAHRKEYVAIILDTLRKINQSFEKLECRELVPMPDDYAVLVSYPHLRALEARKVETYFPDGATHDYSVQELLGGIDPPRRTVEQILEILQSIKESSDTPQTLLKKAEQMVILQPNFMGFGIDIKQVVKTMFRRRAK